MSPAELPRDHPLRNKPLREVGAQVRNVHSKTWRPVANWVIGRYTFNELGPVWLEFNEWRFVGQDHQGEAE